MPPSDPSISPNTPSTSDLIAWDRAYLWHPFTPMKPWCETKEIIVIERGDREFLIDTEGRRYIDGVSSLWCNVHGHNVPELNDAVNRQLAKIAHSSLLGLANVPSILLAKQLVELARRSRLNLDKVFYSDNGSTAVEVACKMTFQYWRNAELRESPASNAPTERRSRFIAFENAYHGDTLGAVSVGGIPLFHRAFAPLCFPVDFVPVPQRQEHGSATLARVENLVRQDREHYAGIIVEPLIQGAGGMLTHPPGFLAALRRLADKYGLLLIADEVMTGFGRTGKMFACEHENVTPDFLCLSKGLTGGYMPLGVTLTTRKIFDAFYVDPNLPGNAAKTFFHGHTFTGHPLACAVASASLDLMDRNALLDHVHELEPILASMLERAKDRPGVADVRRCGLIGAIDLVHPETRQSFPSHWRIAGELCTQMRPHGVMLRPLADTLVIMPPLAISAENLRRLMEVILESLTRIPEIVHGKQNSCMR